MMKKYWIIGIIILSSLSQVISQGTPYSVAVRLDYAPAVLNPITYLDSNGEEMLRLIYQPLTGIDPVTMRQVPILVENLPQAETDSLGRLSLTYKLRPEAAWDYGRAVVARDVEFSIKAMKCPRVDNADRRSIFKDLLSCKMYTNDPRKITLIFREPSFEAFEAMNDLFIIDPFTYDPSNYLGEFSFEELDSISAINDLTLTNKKLVKFARALNGRNYEGTELVGTGAYSLKPIGMDDNLVLQKKKKWWGDLLEGVNSYFSAYPNEILFTIVEDDNDAIKLLSAGKLDVLGDVSTQVWSSVSSEKQAQKDYSFLQSNALSFEYLGMNCRKATLSDARVRRAFGYMIDYAAAIQSRDGNAKRITSFVPNSLQDYCNTDLKPYEYNLVEAQKLLTEAGWIDSDGDKWLDSKQADGEKATMRLTYVYNNDFPFRKVVGDNLKIVCKGLGIDLSVQGFNADFYREILAARTFDIYAGGWFTGPSLLNAADIWQKNGVYNFTGYESPTTDSLITSVRQATTPLTLAERVKALQQELYNDAPFLYLYAPTQNFIISRRFKNVGVTSLTPGYWVAGFKI